MILPLILKYNVFAAPITDALSVIVSAIDRIAVLNGIVTFTPLKPKDIKEDLTYRDFIKKSRESSERMKKDKAKRAEINSMSAYKDKKEKGIKFYDKKGTGRIKAGKKVYD